MIYSWIGTLATICLLLNVIRGRNVPYYDLEDDFYKEVRNILAHHLSQQGAPKIVHPREVRRWGVNAPLGQVSGVSVNADGNPVILHRGKREWRRNTFNASGHFQLEAEGPILEQVVVTLDQRTGDVLKTWGGGLFYLPHGIFVDSDGNTWITDVAMHQVLKFPTDSESPSLMLGEKFTPGGDTRHFCKPSAVSVASSGDIFVADGYCNARILRFSSDGTPIGQFGHLGSSVEESSLKVPHGLALNEQKDTLCIADRDNGRVVCVKAGLNEHKQFGELSSIIPEPNRIRVFDIAILGDQLVGVSGSEDEGIATGFTMDGKEASYVDQWAPALGFRNPHSIATSQNGEAIYVAEIGPNRVWKFVLESDIY